MNSNCPPEQNDTDNLPDPQIIQSVTKKKEQLLERLHRLSDRVKTFDSRAQEMSEAEPEVPAPKPAIPHNPKHSKEPARHPQPAEPKQIVKSQYETLPPHEDQVERNLKCIQWTLSSNRYLNEDYRKSMSQLNDLQTRAKLMCGKIDKACELMRNLDSKYAPDSKSTMAHLFEQLAVCLHGKPSSQTLALLREEYEVVVSPYFS